MCLYPSSNNTTERGGFLNHIIALESRAMKRANIGQTLYLPVIFAVYGILLGISIGCHSVIQQNVFTDVLTSWSISSISSNSNGVVWSWLLDLLLALLRHLISPTHRYRLLSDTECYSSLIGARRVQLC